MTVHRGGDESFSPASGVRANKDDNAVFSDQSGSDQATPLGIELTAGSAAVNGSASAGGIGVPVSQWEIRYQGAVVLSDCIATLLAVLLGIIFITQRHGPDHLSLAMSSITAAFLIGSLGMAKAWESRVLGQGSEEFRRLGRGVFTAGVALALIALAFNAGHIRPWVFGVVPAAGLFASVFRYLLRRVLHARRREGRCMLPVLAAGNVEEVADLIARTHKEQHNGWRIEAACTSGGVGENGTGEVAGVPVVGDLEDLDERVAQGGYRVVAVVPDPKWTRRRLQQLAWQLESTAAEVVVSPVLMEITGPRLHVAPVFGLPLLRVTAPRFDGFRWVVKSVLDRVGAAFLVLLMTPLLLAIAVAIKATDGGPVFYRQTRVGRNGSMFAMIKFRSMVIDAEQQRQELEPSNEGAGPLFKLKRDPRITRIGGVLRRYSLDELPQLFNVLGGSMSLVGPRPPLPKEVAAYGPAMRRRLKVKPGLTGLWQVSGRSDLSWTESERLDLRYVENWSLALDLMILWKTFRAVISGEGAY